MERYGSSHIPTDETHACMGDVEQHPLRRASPSKWNNLRPLHQLAAPFTVTAQNQNKKMSENAYVITAKVLQHY